MRVPAKNIRESAICRDPLRVSITTLLFKLQNRQRVDRDNLQDENETDDQ